MWEKGLGPSLSTECTAKTDQTGWSESLLGTLIIVLVLSSHGSYIIYLMWLNEYLFCMVSWYLTKTTRQNQSFMRKYLYQLACWNTQTYTKYEKSFEYGIVQLIDCFFT